MTSAGRRWSTVAFSVAVAAVAASHLLVVWHSLTVARLWEDEAFNLTVPLNLVQGLGYTSDGTLSGSELTPFDPRISTGPAVLLPIAAVLAAGGDLVIGARTVPLLYFLALIVAVAVLGRRLAGRWGALVAAAVPVAFTAAALPSPIQGPADVLGEVPAAALLAWAVVVLAKRPWLAGLLVGVAIQAKYISLLALPAVVVGFVLLTIGLPWLVRVRRLIVSALLAAAPTVAMEVYALLSLGPAGFRDHLRRTVDFVRDGGQTDRASGPAAKAAALLESWYLPPVVVVVVLLIVTAVLAWATVDLLRHRRPVTGVLSDPRTVTLVVASLGLLTYLGWWLTAGHLPAWVRHPAPGVLAFVPVLMAAAVAAIHRLQRRRPAGSAVASVAGGVLAVALGAQVVWAGVTALPTGNSPLAAQRVAASVVAESGAEWIATPWGPRIGIVVLAGAHVALTDAPTDVIADYPRLASEDEGCRGPALVSAPPYVLCAP
jgi:hypothetical protein